MSNAAVPAPGCRGGEQAIPAGATITAATMTLNMVSGTSTANNADAYQVTGGEWTSASLQWSNKPAANIRLEENISHNNKTKYQFSCLAAVQHWYDGDTTGQHENYGIMLCYHNPDIADYNSVYSADCTDATLRPSMVISYQVATIVVDEYSVLEGYTLTLPSPDTTESITWSSSDTSVATVNSSGVVTGIKAGKVTITASVEDVADYTYIVYVKIDNGVYRIDSNNSNFYLAANSGTLENAHTFLRTVSSEGMPLFRQVWRIAYLSAGYYVIRPMHNQNMALHAKNGVSDVTTIGSENTLSAVPMENRWTIEWINGGYVLKCQGDSTQTLKCSNSNSGASVFTGTYIANNSAFKWHFEDSPTISPQVLMLDMQTGEAVNNISRAIVKGQTITPMDLGLVATFVCSYYSNFEVTWYSSVSSAVSIVPETGAMTAIANNGSSEIMAQGSFVNSVYFKRLTVHCAPVPSGTYYIKSGAYDKYIQISNEAAPSYAAADAVMEHWSFDGEECQKWSMELQNNGYYSIVSAKSGLALTVSFGQTGEADALLVQKTYTGSSRQQWKIIPTNDGHYKVKAKSSEGFSSDYVMSVDYTTQENMNGTYIAQREYVADISHLDEWDLYAIGTEAFFLGVNASEAGHDHYTVYGSVIPIAQKLGYDGINCIVTDGISLEDTQDYLEQCKIFVSRGHAGANENDTAICLNKNPEERSDYLYSSDLFSYAVGCPVVDLSGCELMLFVGCSTAAVEGKSLPDAAVAAGATYAIGFETPINCNEGSEWIQYFFEYYSRGYSVAESARRASNQCGESSSVQSVRVVS